MKCLSLLATLALSVTTLVGSAAAGGSSPVAGGDDQPPDARAAHALVNRELVQPLAAKETTRSKFSRARLAAQDRRIRIVDAQPHKDSRGASFLRFAVDARHGLGALDDSDASQWRLATITGCVYLAANQVFVKKGDQHRPAAFLLGKNLKAAADGTCEAVATKLAQSP